MRIRVNIDINQPLKRFKKIKHGGGLVTVNFKYEKLQAFCFICGKLGHTESFCESLFDLPEEKAEEVRQGPKGWGLFLKADDRRAFRSAGDQWLRKGGEGASGTRDRVFTANQGGGSANLGPYPTNLGESGVQRKSSADPNNLGVSVIQGAEGNCANSVEDPYIHGVLHNNSIDLVNAGGERANQGLQVLPTNFLVNPCFEDDIDDPLLHDLKKRKRGATLHGSSMLHADTSTISVTEESLENESQHFLLTGPAPRACRE